MLHSRCSAARRPMDNVAFYVEHVNYRRKLGGVAGLRVQRQWRNNGVGRMGKVQGPPSSRQKNSK